VVAQDLRQGLRPVDAEGARNRSQGTEAGKAALDDFDSVLPQALLTITMEGFFADPIYGGNRNKAVGGWSAIPFPAVIT
jgi:hypothetical protein